MVFCYGLGWSISQGSGESSGATTSPSPSARWGLCGLQCVWAAQTRLHRNPAFLPGVTHYLLPLMSELGQNFFLLLPPQKSKWQRRKLESMEIIAKFTVARYILKWGRLRSDQVSDLKQFLSEHRQKQGPCLKRMREGGNLKRTKGNAA